MSRAKRLTVVLQLTEKAENSAAEVFEGARRLLESERLKLVELRDYYLDYEQVFAQSRTGVRAQDIARQRAFLGQLAEAQKQQARIIEQREQLAAQKKSAWHRAHLKHRALKELVARFRIEEGRVLSRQEEKILEEWYQTASRRTDSHDVSQ